MNRLCVGKSLVQASSTECQKPRSNKTAFSEFFFLKNAIDVAVTSSCVQMMTRITESKKNQQVERSENVFQFLSNSSINSLAYEVFVRNVSSNLLVPFCFCCEF